jgi:hypothetical protein
MESFIKDSLITKKVKLLNIFETIQELKKMVITKTNKLFIDRNTGEVMSLSEYKRLIREQNKKSKKIPHF